MAKTEKLLNDEPELFTDTDEKPDSTGPNGGGR